MQWIELTKAVPGYVEGAVLSVDEGSAKALIDRGDAKEAENPGERGGMFARASSRAGFVTQIAEADPPPGAIEQQLAEHTKPELVELAKGRLVDDDGVALTDAEVAKLSKDDLKARLAVAPTAGGSGTGGVTGLGGTAGTTTGGGGGAGGGGGV